MDMDVLIAGAEEARVAGENRQQIQKNPRLSDSDRNTVLL
jgi:hypothetical protein